VSDSESPARRLRASERLMALQGLAAPPPMTADEEAGYQASMDRADADLAAVIARRDPRAA
jgi:hypothetical protein